MRTSRRSFVRMAWTTLATIVILLGVGTLSADDWPMYRHDAARSGITSEKLPMPLAESWVSVPRHGPEPAWDLPKPKPVEGILELPRVHFDDTFHVAVAGNALYFGSSSENKVYCLDTATGKIRWTRRVGGPVRLAPTISNGRLYVGSDDGYAYCLDAEDGKTIWTFKAAPHDEKLLGSGKMISLWPLRTGVLVDAGVAYFSAGIFPMEGVYFYAVNAEDGTLVWRNDTCGETHQSAISPQGYLLASETDLFAPMGRVSPAAFDRKTGKMRYTSYFGKTVGGTYALLADNRVFTGTREKMAFDQKSRARFAWYPGRQLLVAPDASYMVNEKEIFALDRTEYPKLSLKRTTLVSREQRINSPLYLARKRVNKYKAQIKHHEETIATLEKQCTDLATKGKEREATALQSQLANVRKTLAGDKKGLDTAQKEVEQLTAQRKKLREDLKETDEALASCFKWRTPCDCSDSLILADDVLIAGGQGKVMAVDTKGGKPLWSVEVRGKAKGLAVASRKLFVSTDTGAIHCFAPKGAASIGRVTEPSDASPYPDDALTSLCHAAAEEIVRRTGIKRGFCLVLGAGTGRLACELAKRTDLRICAVEPDPKKAEMARKALDAAGLFGARVTVDVYDYDEIPYADYFANLIVSEEALTTGKIPGTAQGAFRMLKPLGGTICIGQPASAGEPKLSAASLKQWIATADPTDAEVSADKGVWLTCTRGALPGAGKWTHEYADPGNTTCSDDQLVKCPLGLLWFGSPGPTRIFSRHSRAAAPVAINGNFFYQGEEVIMAYDSYNGLKLWERDIPGAARLALSVDCSNLAANEDSLFLAVKDQCLRLDQATGKIQQTYSMPKADDGKPRVWGLVACVGNLLYGTRTQRSRLCECLFAVDIATGKVTWNYTGKNISQASISLGDGKAFLVDCQVSDAERQRALEERMTALEKLSGIERLKAEQELKSIDVRMAVALDATDGKIIWTRPLDLTGISKGPYWQAVASMYKNNVLMLFGIYTDGHYWKEFFAGEFESRRVIALSGDKGKTLWTKHIGFRVRPIIVGDTFHAEPWAFDLHTGEQRMRTHPITGLKDPWQYARPGHHCGCPAASPHTLLFRSGTFGYFDLVNDYGTMHWGAQRPGCWINFIPANGVLNFPEASAGCMCPFPNQCSYVFKHRERNRAWAQFSAPGGPLPVKHWAINLGAPGDRRDSKGRLWLNYPRAGGSLVYRFDIEMQGIRGGGYFKENSDTIRIEGTDSPWIFASGYRGLAKCVLPLLSDDDGEALYTVRLAFADLDNTEAGKRVFDIKVQDKVVCTNFDIVKEAGGGHKAVVKEFNGIAATDKLKIEFAIKTKTPGREQMPMLQGIEIVREKMLGLGCAPPSFLINDKEPEKSGELRLANNTDKDFDGTIRLTAPEGFTVTPTEAPLRLSRGERTAVAMSVRLAKAMPAGMYAVSVKLLRRDGSIESERKAPIEHLANRGRMIVKAVEDAHVGKSTPDANSGGHRYLNIDGGHAKMEDESHHLAYMKFVLAVPGKPVSAILRLYNAGNPSGDSGQVRVVTSPWSETKVTYVKRPQLGDVVAKIGRVSEHQVVELPLKVDLSGLKEISLAIDPTSCDGINYISREGGKPAELIVEYEP